MNTSRPSITRIVGVIQLSDGTVFDFRVDENNRPRTANSKLLSGSPASRSVAFRFLLQALQDVDLLDDTEDRLSVTVRAGDQD